MSLLGYMDSDNMSHPSITRIVMSGDGQPITTIQITKAGDPGKSIDRFHQGMEKMFVSMVKTDALKKLDGMDERMEVIATQDRNIANSKASTVFNDDNKSGLSKSQEIEEHFLPKNSLGLFSAPPERDQILTDDAVARKIFAKKKTSLASTTDMPLLASTSSKTRPLLSKHSRLVSGLKNDQVRLSVVELIERSTPTKEKARSKDISVVVSSIKLDVVNNVTDEEPDTSVDVSGDAGQDVKVVKDEVISHAEDIARDEVVEDAKKDDIQVTDVIEPVTDDIQVMDVIELVTDDIQVTDVIELVTDDVVVDVIELVTDDIQVTDVIELVTDVIEPVTDVIEDVTDKTTDVTDEGKGDVIGGGDDDQQKAESNSEGNVLVMVIVLGQFFRPLLQKDFIGLRKIHNLFTKK